MLLSILLTKPAYRKAFINWHNQGDPGGHQVGIE